MTSNQMNRSCQCVPDGKCRPRLHRVLRWLLYLKGHRLLDDYSIYTRLTISMLRSGDVLTDRRLREGIWPRALGHAEVVCNLHEIHGLIHREEPNTIS